VAVLYLAARVLILGAGTLQPSIDGFGLFLQYGLVYAKSLVLPWPLPFFLSAARGVFERWEIVAGVLAVSAMAVVVARGSRVARWGAALVALPLAPALMLAFNAQPVFAGRFLYLPSAGAVILLAAALPARWFLGKPMWYGFGAALVVMGALSASATQVWLDELSLMRHAVASAPDAPEPRHVLGDYYERRGQLREALAEYQHAAGLGTPRADYFNSLGRVWGVLGDFQQSAHYYQESLALDPSGSHANNGMGNVYFTRGDYRSALGHYRKAVAADPANAEAHYNLATACTALGLLEEARRHREAFLLVASSTEFAAQIEQVKRALGR
jgi:tetratricopeptide (TPR) repeat protein